jgi:exo-beta-1,3-glucanase (GH17 family)
MLKVFLPPNVEKKITISKNSAMCKNSLDFLTTNPKYYYDTSTDGEIKEQRG